MDQVTKSRIALYKEAIALEEKRACLQSELDDLLARLSEIKNHLFDADGVVSTASIVLSKVAKRATGRARRGELKQQILSALAAAGSAGVRVKDLASTLGTKLANIHSWFQSSTKRIPQIKKIGEARYRLEGALDSKELGRSTTSSGFGKAMQVNAPTKSGKRRRSTRPLGKRGELSTRILTALKGAGNEGLKVSAMADKLGVKQKNLYIWFSTTGKKNPAVRKIGEAHYKFEAAAKV